MYIFQSAALASVQGFMTRCVGKMEWLTQTNVSESARKYNFNLFWKQTYFNSLSAFSANVPLIFSF